MQQKKDFGIKDSWGKFACALALLRTKNAASPIAVMVLAGCVNVVLQMPI